MTKKEVKDAIQFWYSKYCNSIMRDERAAFLRLANSYQNLYDYMESNHLESLWSIASNESNIQTVLSRPGGESPSTSTDSATANLNSTHHSSTRSNFGSKRRYYTLKIKQQNIWTNQNTSETSCVKQRTSQRFCNSMRSTSTTSSSVLWKSPTTSTTQT